MKYGKTLYTGRITIRKFYIKDIERNGCYRIGKPGRLSGELSNYWSRRIDCGNRIVYRIDGNVIKIVQCGSHYRDK